MEDWALLIDEYLTGRLTSEERSDFEAAMQANPELARELAFTRTLIQATGERDVEDLRRQMQAIAEEHVPKTKATGWLSPVWRWYWLGGFFALCIVAVLLYLLLPGLPPRPSIDRSAPVLETPPAEVPSEQSKPPEPPVANQDQPPAIQPVQPAPPSLQEQVTDKRYAALAEEEYAPGYNTGRRSTQIKSKEASLLEDAFLAYADSDYIRVIRLLTTLPVERSLESDALKLRAHAEFRQHLFAAAAKDFGLLAQKNTVYHYDAEWYRLLSLAAQWPRSRVAFDNQFNIMTRKKDPVHPFRQQAFQLKARMDALTNR